MASQDAEEDLAPRNYQYRLMNTVLDKNTIIFLPTGSGKTYIAVMALKKFAEALEKPYSQDGKLAVMTVNTVALVDQQSKYIRRYTTFKVGAYTGEMNVDMWDKSTWEKEFNKNNVLVLTAQILVNILNSHFLSLSKVRFLIFDECHHGVSDQPMRNVMKCFQHESDPPRVLGLTASLLNKNCKINKVLDELLSLETTYHAKIATVEELEDVIGYSTNPQERIKCYGPHTISKIEFEVLQRLDSFIEALQNFHVKSYTKRSGSILLNNPELQPLDSEKGCKDLINVLKDAKLHVEMFGIYGSMLVCISYCIQIECAKKQCQDLNMYNLLSGICAGLASMKKKLMNYMEGTEDKDKVYKYSSPKVLNLLKCLMEFRQESERELCGIIFVQRRFTAKILYHILSDAQKYNPELAFLKPNFIVGLSSNPYCETREGHFKTKMNRKVLNSFCMKEINLLIATNVIEEGVDIPTCTCIIKFDEPPDYRSYIQSKGRARHKESRYYILVELGNYKKFMEKYKYFRLVETKLNQYLIGKTEERDDPSEEKIQEMYCEHPVAPYYVKGKESAHVDMLSAIPLLTMYCQSLPSDVFTTYNPGWYIDKMVKIEKNMKVTLYRVYIELPIICPILKPIEGDFMPNKKLAKRAAALKACIALHKIGELDDSLVPVKRSVPDPCTNFLFKHWPAEKEKYAGNKKTQRYYTKKIADCLKGPILPNKPLYLHLIMIEPKFNKNDLNKSVLFDLLTSNLCFGVVSSKPLYKICDFPIYLSAGEINVSLVYNWAEVKMSKEEIKDLKSFHDLIFFNILEIVKPFMMMHSSVDEETLLIAPVQKEKRAVDFDTIRTYRLIYDQKAEPTSTERMNLEVTDGTHLGKIVTPWYRCDEIQYIVTKVCTDMTAMSPFVTDEFPTYYDYFKEKYQCTILNPNLPLLLVKRISKRLNCLKPRGNKGKKKKEDVEDGFEEHLLPELCVKQDFPGSLWIQANLLPTILYRVHQLLKTEEFRRLVAQEAHLGTVQLSQNQCWDRLYMDTSIPEEQIFYEKLKDVSKSMDVEPIAVNMTELNYSIGLIAKQFKKDIDTKLLELKYPWRDADEPVDIDRNLDVTLMDIQYYQIFVSKKLEDTNENEFRKSSPKCNQNMLAITYNETFNHKDIKLLQHPSSLKGPELSEMYKAITAIHCNEIVNFERLETLGDSFLKYICSLYIILKYPMFDEGKSTTLKSKLVSNKNLYYLAIKKNLGSLLQYWEFQPKSEWCPPGYIVPSILKNRINREELPNTSLYTFDISDDERISGILKEDTIHELKTAEYDDLPEEKTRNSMCHFLGCHYIPDKIVADVVEALLGAYFKSCGIQGGLKFMEWLRIIPEEENISNILKFPMPDPILDSHATIDNINFHVPSWRNIEETLGYHFNNRAYLLQALTHASYTSNRITSCYQRLEFLGDAILDFLITCHIYESCGNLSPGDLTDLRSALVNNVTFACFTVKYGFYKFMLSMNQKLEASIDKFVDYQENKNFVINDDVIILLNEDDLHIGESVDVPKALGDVFEALAGAVFLDSGMNLKKVWEVFYKIIWKEVESFSENVPKNAIRLLHETPGAYPVFHKALELDNGKIMVKLDFMLNGAKKRVHGFGDNKTVAKKAAAKIALRLIS